MFAALLRVLRVQQGGNMGSCRFTRS